MSRDRIISPETVNDMIAKGGTIVIFEEYVLHLNSWLDKHPGGRLAILHMVGRDATDEITVYHTERTLRTMKAYRIGRKPMGPWTNRTPPLRGGVFQTGTQLAEVPESQIRLLDQKKALVNEGYGSGVCQDPPRDQPHRSISCTEPEYAAGNQVTSPRAAPSGRAGYLKNGTVKIKKLYSDDKFTEVQVALNPEEWTEWAIRQGELNDRSNFPSLDPNIQDGIATKYKLLHRRIQNEGLYRCSYIEYGKEIARYTALFGTFFYTLSCGSYMTSAVFLGLFWHQIMFTAHDAGHRAITSMFVVDTLIGLFIADLCCGLSMGWWKSSHNVHHLITNMPEHDPDIQNLPLFATCPSFFKSLRSSYYDFTFVWDAAAEYLVPYQKYTYYPVMGIARFNLYLLSWLHVLSSKSSSLGSSKAWWIRPTEIAFMTCYWFIFGYILLWRTLPTWTIRVTFVLISHIVTMPLHVQITLSHWGMSTSNLGEDESFPQRQLRTTLDIDCPPWLDFIYGGLQFQAIHHLFPRLPRHNLRKVQVMVREFCADTGVPYSILGFMDGNSKVIGRLDELSKQVAMLVNCQKYMAETGESGLY